MRCVPWNVERIILVRDRHAIFDKKLSRFPNINLWPFIKFEGFTNFLTHCQLMGCGMMLAKARLLWQHSDSGPKMFNTANTNVSPLNTILIQFSPSRILATYFPNISTKILHEFIDSPSEATSIVDPSFHHHNNKRRPVKSWCSLSCYIQNY
jgi:hypothetical protein